MKAWKTVFTFVIIGLLTALVSCASEQKRAQEEARIEARAKELAAEIVQQTKEVEKAATEKKLDSKLVTSDGMVWWSAREGGAQSDDQDYAFIFFTNGRWAEPLEMPKFTKKDLDRKWYVEDSKLFLIEPSRFGDTIIMPYQITLTDNGEKSLKFNSVSYASINPDKVFVLCNPYHNDDCKSILERVDINRLSEFMLVE